MESGPKKRRSRSSQVRDSINYAAVLKCRRGYDLITLAEMGASRVVGLELSNTAVRSISVDSVLIHLRLANLLKLPHLVKQSSP
jgi:hypothetical protein